jgi:NitT/TauT family transport system ATP-binding protein
MQNPKAASTAAPLQVSPRLGEEILRVNHVSRGFSKTQGELLVLDDVNLSLGEGEIVGMLGRSGSGKSTLLRIISGLIEPSAGEVSYLGKPLDGPAKGVAMVFQTFAVFMCDRILVLSSNPGRVVADIKVPFGHPRNRLEPEFRALVDEIYAKMTARQTDEAAKTGLEPGSRLPSVSTNLMAGLIETLAAEPYNGRADMPEIARSLQLEVDDLFPVAEALHYLGFADVREGDIILTPAARTFAEFGTQERKMMFAEHLLRHVPLAAGIKKVLNERPGHRAPRVRFEQELEDFLSDSAAQETLDAVINWGRYGEIFSYNDKTEIFSLADVES